MIRRFINAGTPFRPSPLVMLGSYIVLGLWSIFVLFAIYWVIITAFKTPGDVNNGPRYIPFVDYQPSLDAWHYMLVESGENFVWRPYLSTVIVGLWSSLFALILGAS